MTATLTERRQHADATEISPAEVKQFITARLARREKPGQIADDMMSHLGIEIESEQVIPFWTGQITLPTQTERRPDKESVQLAADEVNESLFTRLADDETPDILSVSSPPDAVQPPFSIALDSAQVSDGASDADEAPATQTGRRQDQEESLQIPADAVDEPAVTREARRGMLEALAAQAKARLGIAPDPAEATQTGRRQDEKATVLTDEMKVFIVKGLARYETPTRVAASVQAEFGVAITRRQVYAYDPAGSRPPAKRWIDLHAATRAKFLRAASEIGVAQKVVRLRMLDRFANRAEENNYTERAARFLAQAAYECGGFYERYARPKGAAA